jgi:hypothetical protein
VFAGEYLEWSKANKKPCSYGREGSALGAVQVDFSGQKLSDITPWLIEKYKKEPKDQGKSNQSVNLELACLKARFSKAIIWRKAMENPEISPLSKVKKAM